MPITVPEQYNLDPGVDYTALFAGYASALEQGIQLAQPNSIHGMILYQETMPQTVGTYPGGPPNWFEQNLRFGWIKPSTGAFHVYRAGVGYENVATKIPINTITTAMLQDHSVTPIKLWAPNNAAQAGWSFVLDAGGVNWLIADLIAARPDKSIAIAKLQPSTTDLDFIRTIGGNTVWAPLTAANLNTILAQVGGGLLNTNAIDVSPWSPLFIARVNAAGTFLEFVNPSDLLQDNTIPISRLAVGTGNAGKYVGVNATGTGMVFITPPVIPPTVNVIYAASDPIAVPAVGTNTALSFSAHPITVSPITVIVELVCIAPDLGFSIGARIPINAVFSLSGGTYINTFQVDILGNNVNVIRDNTSDPVNFVILRKNPVIGLATQGTPANWQIVATALVTA